MTDPAPIIPSFPVHQPPRGIPIAHPKQQGILTKVLGRMLRPRPRTNSRGPKKGLAAPQTVKLKHKKIKYW